MNDEAKDDGIVIDGPEAVSEQPEISPESTPDGDGASESEAAGENQQGKITFSDEQQQVFNDAIGKKVAKQREAEQKVEQLQQELADLQSKLPQETRPDVPAMPDRYDFDNDQDFSEAVAKRDEALRAQERYDATQKAAQEAEQAQERQRLHDEQQKIMDRVDSYSQRAVELGITEDELAAAGGKVANYGISADLANFILGHADGPLITAALAANPVEMDNLRSMDYGNAAVHIVTNIVPTLDAFKPKPSSAPEPTPVLSGGGVPPKEIGPKGATYD